MKHIQAHRTNISFWI